MREHALKAEGKNLTEMLVGQVTFAANPTDDESAE